MRKHYEFAIFVCSIRICLCSTFFVKTLVDEIVTAGVLIRKTWREYFLLDTLIIMYREYWGDKGNMHESLQLAFIRALPFFLASVYWEHRHDLLLLLNLLDKQHFFYNLDENLYIQIQRLRFGFILLVYLMKRAQLYDPIIWSFVPFTFLFHFVIFSTRITY